MKLSRFLAAAALAAIASAGCAFAGPIGPWFVPQFGTGAPSATVPISQPYFDNSSAPYQPYIYDRTIGAWAAYGGSSSCPGGGLTKNILYKNFGACAGIPNATYDGTMATFGQFQFTGLQTSDTAQDINDQKGDIYAPPPSATPYSPQMLAFTLGTAASPNTASGPLVTFGQTIGATASGCHGGSAIDMFCNATAVFFSREMAAGNTQNTAATFAVQSAQSACPNCDAPAVIFRSYVVDEGANKGGDKPSLFGGIVENDSSFATPQMKIVEIDVRNNNSTGGNCPNATTNGTGACGGFVLDSQGTQAPGTAFHLLADPGSPGFNDGFVINSTAVSHNTFWDASSSATSIEIDGTHATAAINISNNAGNFFLGGGNTFYGGGSAGQAGKFAMIGNNFYPDGSDTFASVSDQAAGDVSIYGDNAGAAFRTQKNTGTGTQFFGVPTAPTAAANTNTTQLATTAFVVGQGYCQPTGSAGIISNNGSSACTTDTNASLLAGTLSLGASGTLGAVVMGNATSGTVNLQPVTGALGTVTASLPANTGTIAETNLAQTWAAAQNMGGNQITGVTNVVANSASGFQLVNGTCNSVTAVTVAPNKAGTTGGLGCHNVAGDASLIGGGTEALWTEGTNVTLKLPLVQKNYTVSTLPTGTQGALAFVTDATACTFLGSLTGGGSVVCPVFYDGSAWKGA